MKKRWQSRLGEIAGKFHRLWIMEQMAHEEVDAFFAPGECHGLVSSGFRRAWAKMEEEVLTTWGCSLAQISQELGKRVSEKYLFFQMPWTLAFEEDDRG